MKTITITLTALSLVIFASCKQEQTKIHKNPAPVAEVKLDPKLFNTQLEKGISVTEARKLKSGDEVTVSGKILGARSVFVDGRASFIIGNPDVLISCDLKPGDNCPIPWDVCCDGKETIASNTVSIQVVDDSGKVLKIRRQI